MEKLTHCPNCNSKLKGLMSSIRMYSEAKMSFIEAYSGNNIDALCEKCGKEDFESAKTAYDQDRRIVKAQIKSFYSSFPILTIQPHSEWNYVALGLVTAQTTKDNRVNNNSLIDSLLNINQNLVDLDTSANSGEKVCFELLRQKTYAMGGNAIVGLDIDYAEFGLKGELMLICMAGTAIKVKDFEKLNEKIVAAKAKFNEYKDKVDKVAKYGTLVN